MIARCFAVMCGFTLAGCGSPGYNDNPSQQARDDRVGCLASTDFFAVYFSLRLQPSDLAPDARVTQELFQSYCHEVPRPGTLFLTVDLVGNELPTIPLRVRVLSPEMPPGDAGEEAAPAEVRELPPHVYTKGVIETSFSLDRIGAYTIEIVRGGQDPAAEKDIVRIPLNVGVAPSLAPWLTDLAIRLVITLVVVALCWTVFLQLKRRGFI